MQPVYFTNNGPAYSMRVIDIVGDRAYFLIGPKHLAYGIIDKTAEVFIDQRVTVTEKCFKLIPS